jgi:hypothetical protein
MKNLLLVLLLFIPLMNWAETGEEPGTEKTFSDPGEFGLALYSGFNGEVYAIRLGLGGTYTWDIWQFELGLGIHPVVQSDQSVFSVDHNTKLFPNGLGNKVNFYFLGNLAYVYNHRETFFPTTYNYIFFNAGYGFEVMIVENLYLDTNVSYGGFTYSKTTDNPAQSYLDAEQLFLDYGSNLAFQLNLGYRF